MLSTTRSAELATLARRIHVGSRVRYHGDVANASGDGAVIDVTAAETAAISRIAKRAKREFPNSVSVIDVTMDLAATHANGCPLDLEKLERAPDFDFAHDIMGIRRHLDRDDNSPTGGKLLNCFVPRCAKRD